jgi:hypothetical protein
VLSFSPCPCPSVSRPCSSVPVPVPPSRPCASIPSNPRSTVQRRHATHRRPAPEPPRRNRPRPRPRHRRFRSLSRRHERLRSRLVDRPARKRHREMPIPRGPASTRMGRAPPREPPLRRSPTPPRCGARKSPANSVHPTAANSAAGSARPSAPTWRSRKTPYAQAMLRALRSLRTLPLRRLWRWAARSPTASDPIAGHPWTLNGWTRSLRGLAVPVSPAEAPARAGPAGSQQVLRAGYSLGAIGGNGTFRLWCLAGSSQ